MDDLLPCPFCGETNLRVEGAKDGAIHMSRVVCKNCGATTGYSYGDHVRKWNSRAALTPAPDGWARQAKEKRK